MSELTSADAEGLAASSRIPGYRVEQPVGRGAAGVVFQAHDEQHGQPVALKIIGPPLAGDQAFASRLLRETQVATRVGEPHILPVLQAGEADGKLFVVMPYISGGDARSLVGREGPLLPERVAPIVWRVASALDAAHGAGLVHGDVKPGNILVDSRPGQPDLVYLSDFGQGRPQASGPVMAGTPEAVETQDCIAPEQVEGNQFDGRADQYSLACVAFELLTGGPAFRPDDPAATRLPRPEPPKASALRPGLSPAVDDVLGRAMAQVAAYRYASCRAFADALHAAFWPGSSPGQPTPGPLPAAYDAAPAPAAAPAAYDAAPALGGVAAGYAAGAGPAWMPAPHAAASAPADAPAGPFLTDAPLLGPGAPGAPGAPGSAAPVPAAPGPGSSIPGAPLPGGEPWLASGGGRRRRFRVAPFVYAGVGVLAVGGLVAGLLVGMGGSHGTSKPTGVHIAARSGNAPASGDVWTQYGLANLSHAEIHGDITGAANGEVARLYAQPFPFSGAAVPGSSVTLHPSGTAATAAYSFQVTPNLATRYHVEVFQSSKATSVLASSPAMTVYVTLGSTEVSTGKPCGRPVCHKTITSDVFVPASALNTELSKKVFLYFAINLNAAGTAIPPKPTTVVLGAADGRATTKAVSATEYQQIVTFTFTIGKKDQYDYVWNACTQDTEAQDGIGLPGHHGCGDSSIPYPGGYVG